MSNPALLIKQVTIDCLDPNVLSDFYARLLYWRVEYADDSFVRIIPGDSPTELGFQRNEDYIPPLWPEGPDKQQRMERIDFYICSTEEMAGTVEHAISCGAKKADTQYSKYWTVILDPEGYSFCINLL